ncbi:leucine-rich repeat domain-containing protein [Ulvibacterium sp.]|uniref:leucine-rich repeat domain-containing protein n=1 Tax=Ulvibacterium sp. TaxID=2665914 RepID=UPI003CC6D989
MKKTFYLLLFSVIFISCSSDTDDSDISGGNPFEEKGKHAFSIDFKDIVPDTSLKESPMIPVPAFALITIADNNGSTILTQEKIAVQKVGEKYITDEIELDAGTYNLMEFIVTDVDNAVISIVPKTNSALSPLTEKTLPFSIKVETDKSSITTTDNIDAEGFKPVDFGYTSLSLTFPKSTDFFSLTIDEPTSITTKTLVLKSITASSYEVDWGDGAVEEYLSTKSDIEEENELTHTYSQENVYTVNISGPIGVIEDFSFYSDNEVGNPLQSNIVSVEIGDLALLKKCHIYYGRLSMLDTSKNLALETLSLGYNQIMSLDLTNNPKLITARLRYNQLTDLNVSQNSNLEFLNVTGNQISDLNVSNNSTLEKLLVRENQLTSLNLANNLELTGLDLSDNSLLSLDVSNNNSLEEINIGRNELTGIDLSKNINLKRIDLYGNQITTIDLSKNLNLRDLYIDDNSLNDIDLSNNPNVERLIIENNNLSNLDLVNNPMVFDLQIGGNQFSSTQLDLIIMQVYEQAVLNSIINGYMNFKNNPGFDEINSTTTDRVIELEETYGWFFNNN